MTANLLIMTIKLILAIILGGIIGYERERNEHPAGIRTHMLVCLGATLIMIISQSFSDQSDPARIAAQIVTGIGFLGAGTILHQGSIVRGLTTAASLWVVAGIGMAIGVGIGLTIYAWLAVIATVLVFATLASIKYIELQLGNHYTQDVYINVLNKKSYVIIDLLDQIQSLGVKLDYMKSTPIDGGSIKQWHIRIFIPSHLKESDIIETITSSTDIIKFEWE